MYRKCITAETGIGMHNYLCDTDGTGGHLKTLPEDFIVREISDPPRQKDKGEYSIATVTARNWETNRMVRLMSRSMGVSRDRIGFAGTKDKRAITTQLMSVYGTEELWQKVDLKDLKIENIYRGARGIEIGDLIGNDFEISVKNCTMDPSQIRETVDSDISIIKQTGGFPNYFGVQRFGAVRPVTHRVGERLVRGDIKGAVMTYISFTTDEEEERLRLIRERFQKADVSEWAEIRQTMPPAMAFERMMLSKLIENPDDWVGAIEILPANLQMMFVHAYQSLLFNEMLSRRMDAGLPLNMPVEGDIIIPLDANKIPLHENPILTTSKNIDLVTRQVRSGRAFVTITLFGSDGELAEGEMGEIERKVIEENKLSHEDFVIPELSRCTSKGSRREILCPLKDIGYEMNDEGYKLKFSLPKGNYATCLLREFMKSEMRDY
ncbi:MAG: tRNA pseudouridine(13) synthase TruD [Candidatus Methanomethylophilaceae archaeon]|nr:tRNA pseudouridine(13) synthase TruD [Candidatus Methanomethylophilaceae archaeon]